MSKEIYNPSIVYSLGRFYVRFAFRFFYRSISVKGLENIPQNVPVIITPNHQNALMDALAIVYTIPGHVVFVARADIFKNKAIARFLHFLKIMPVFRSRDGYSTLGKNDDTFDIALKTLMYSRFFCIMPEGTQSERHQLLPLVKGAFRLAFQYISRFPDKPAPVILPVGIDYSSYHKYKSKLVINIGKSLNSLDFYDSNPDKFPVAINAFREKLTIELKNLMLHIDSIEHYHTINFARKILRPLVPDTVVGLNDKGFENFNADAWLLKKLNKSVSENTWDKIEPALEQLKSLTSKIKLEPENIFEKTKSFFWQAVIALTLLMYFPVYLFTVLFYSVPLLLAKFASKSVNDIQFHGSIKFAVLTLFLPVWFLIFIIIMTNYLPLWLLLAAIVFLLVLGEVACSYMLLWKKWKVNFILWRNKKQINEARDIATHILNSMIH